jgi:hypothetical protein
VACSSPQIDGKQVKVRYVWGTICDPNPCWEALSSEHEGCRYSTILLVDEDFPRKGVETSETLMYTTFGEYFDKYDLEWSASEADWEFAKKWMGLMEKLVADGKMKAHPKRTESGVLEVIFKGIVDLRAERIRGKKLVYR